jgi:Amt family ammonium transporter
MTRDRNWIQLAKQLAWAVTGLSWTFGVTYAIMFVSLYTYLIIGLTLTSCDQIINLIPGCKFRADSEAELVGMDVGGDINLEITM